MSKIELVCLSVILSIMIAVAIYIPYEAPDDPKDLRPGMQPKGYDYVLNYTVTAQDETMGTYSMNMAIYPDQQGCLNLSSAINRERPIYQINGRRFRLMYAACNRVSSMSDEDRAHANFALRAALPAMVKE